jgi:hypothetical protein
MIQIPLADPNYHPILDKTSELARRICFEPFPQNQKHILCPPGAMARPQRNRGMHGPNRAL